MRSTRTSLFLWFLYLLLFFAFGTHHLQQLGLNKQTSEEHTYTSGYPAKRPNWRMRGSWQSKMLNVFFPVAQRPDNSQKLAYIRTYKLVPHRWWWYICVPCQQVTIFTSSNHGELICHVHLETSGKLHGSIPQGRGNQRWLSASR